MYASNASSWLFAIHCHCAGGMACLLLTKREIFPAKITAWAKIWSFTKIFSHKILRHTVCIALVLNLPHSVYLHSLKHTTSHGKCGTQHHSTLHFHQCKLLYMSLETYAIPLNSADILSSHEAAAQCTVKRLCTVHKSSVQSLKNVCVLSAAFLNQFTERQLDGDSSAWNCFHSRIIHT